MEDKLFTEDFLIYVLQSFFIGFNKGFFRDIQAKAYKYFLNIGMSLFLYWRNLVRFLHFVTGFPWLWPQHRKNPISADDRLKAFDHGLGEFDIIYMVWEEMDRDILFKGLFQDLRKIWRGFRIM